MDSQNADQSSILLDEEIDEIRRQVKTERHRIDPHMWVHSPNRIPAGTRIKYLIFSTVLIVYGCVGIWNGGIYFPGKRGPGVYFIGLAMWILFGSIVAAAVNMISVVIDHYDRRSNEIVYRRIARYSFLIGLSLLIITFIVGATNENFR